jgi:hypothetical protein
LRLAQELELRLAAEPSMFRAQLLREDLARLARLCELAAASHDRAAFAAAARRLGWTQGDARTADLAHVLAPFIEAVYDYQHGESGEAVEERIRATWEALTRERLERLVGCLSTPVPRPEA